MNKPKLLLIDSFNILYRAFHGNQLLTSADGYPTGAIHGFLKTVNTIKSLHPDIKCVFTFDSISSKYKPDYIKDVSIEHIPILTSAPSRKEIFADYKNNRSEMPDNLAKQIWILIAILQAQGNRCVEGNEYAEADDILASIAFSAKDQYDVIIGSGDKDLTAMLEYDAITIFNPNTNLMMMSDDVVKKFGVKPSQIEDFLALMGDNVDNIPGVKKCGETTAAKWLNLYGDITGIISNKDKIKGVVGANLELAINNGDLDRARKLSTLRKHIPIDLNAILQPLPVDVSKLQTIYGALTMKTALAKLQKEYSNEFTSQP